MGEAEPSSTLAPGTRVGAYVVAERIGAGGFGEVFRARHPVIGSEVAIKVLNAHYSADAEAVARFIAEARAVNQISHPNIIEIFDFGELSDGRDYFVMELLEGRSLRDVLRDRTYLPFAEALPILRGIAEAVDAAHFAGIAHRDLKPDNVIVLPDGRIKLIDFGLAKLTAENAVPITQTGAVFGTPLFMSPEQCRGRAIDARTDLYSFGVLAYCVLAGQPPFDGDALALALHHLNDVPEPPSRHRAELPAHVDRVVLELLAKDPADRPSPLAKAIAAIEGSIRLPRRIRLAWIAVPVIAALAAGGIVIATRPSTKSTVATDCVSAADRLAPIWSTSIADAAAPKFNIPDRPGVAKSWKLGRPQIDALTSRWAVLWDAACHSADRTSDPFLYGHRIACLDNALFDLRTSIKSIIERPRNYRFDPNFDAGTGGRMLEDCTNPVVLRAQVPPPPQAVRDRVDALNVAAIDATDAAGQAALARKTADADRSIVELDRISRELEQLDPPSATVPILSRVSLLLGIARDVDSTRLPAAAAALDDAVLRIEASGDEVALAEAYIMLAKSELSRGAVDSKADEAATRAESAARRAKSPLGVQLDLADLHVDLLVAHGRYAAAVDAARAALAFAVKHRYLDFDAQRMLVDSLALWGHETEAVVEARRLLAERISAYGDHSDLVSSSTLELGTVLDQAGESAAALAVLDQYTEFKARLKNDAPHHGVWGAVYKLEIMVRGGARPDKADEIVRSITNIGTTPAGQNPDGIATARRAGLFAIFAYAAERPGLTDDDRRADNIATLAFERGDLATAARAAARCAANCADWVAFSHWLAIPRDAVDLEQRLAKLEARYPDRAAAIANSGIILASLGRWDVAKPKLEAARAKPNIWEIQADLVELDTWLALARLHAGDRSGARQLLVEALDSLSIMHNGVAGFSYMMPVANFELAKIVWDEDRAYSRVLAARARDGFARLGSFRDPQRLEVTRWLADHGS